MFRINLVNTDESDEPELKRSIKNLCDKKFLCKEIEDDTIINEINTSNSIHSIDLNSTNLENLCKSDDSHDLDAGCKSMFINSAVRKKVTNLFTISNVHNLDVRVVMEYDKKLIILKSK